MTCAIRAPHLPKPADLGTDRKALEKFFIESGIGGPAALPPSHAPVSHLTLEAPLSRVDLGEELLVGVRAGDIIIALERPHGLSARNLIPAEILSITSVGSSAILETACTEDRGVHFKVNLTHKAVAALELNTGDVVWLVLKTHSCHVMRREARIP